MVEGKHFVYRLQLFVPLILILEAGPKSWPPKALICWGNNIEHGRNSEN
jgi:hypothetical protein